MTITRPVRLYFIPFIVPTKYHSRIIIRSYLSSLSSRFIDYQLIYSGTYYRYIERSVLLAPPLIIIHSIAERSLMHDATPILNLLSISFFFRVETIPLMRGILTLLVRNRSQLLLNLLLSNIFE